MEDFSGEPVSGFLASKPLAKAMAPLLFQWGRVTGAANWERDISGHWKLTRMLIQSFEPLPDEPLAEVFRQLQDVRVSWPEGVEDMLRAERESTL